MRTLAPLVLMACLATCATAELPPYVYEKMRAEAPEVLTVHVTRVDDTETPGDGRAITVWADVVSVTRTGNGKKPGDHVRIRYDLVRRKAGFVGPSQVSVPASGETLTAYLKRDGTVYRPAAGGATFDKSDAAAATRPAAAETK